MNKINTQDYLPPCDILDAYADVLVNFSLNQGKGLQAWETVNLRVWEAAHPMEDLMEKHIIQAGGNIIRNLMPINEFDPIIFQSRNIEKLQQEYAQYTQSIIQRSTHEMLIVADDYTDAWQDNDPDLFNIYKSIKNNYNHVRWAKKDAWKMWYNLAYFPTPSMAQAAGLSMEEYWQEIIHACFLDEANPKEKRKQVFAQIHRYRDKLSAMDVESLRILGDDVDLTIRVGADRKWLWGTGRNMPSYEIFVSPDWRGTEGWINFSEPVYENGKLIDGIQLQFKAGKVVKATAKVWQDLLHTFLQKENFDKLGEFSLTDKRFSRIDKFMANTLYDENRWWKFGNMHIALGDAYKDSYRGDYTKLVPSQFMDKWFNASELHIDIVSTTDRIVQATLKNGKKIIIYANGQFLLD